MSIIDAYGDFEIPEEKSEIEVVENPIKTIDSRYDLFEKIMDGMYKKTNNPFLLNDDKTADDIYSQSCKLFEGEENLKVKQKELFDWMKEKKYLFAGTGLFLSALQNNTSVDKLLVDTVQGRKKHAYLGYKLKPNKLLINRAEVECLGIDCEGTIINTGEVRCCFANCTQGGLQISLTSCSGFRAKKGIQIVFAGKHLR